MEKSLQTNNATRLLIAVLLTIGLTAANSSVLAERPVSMLVAKIDELLVASTGEDRARTVLRRIRLIVTLTHVGTLSKCEARTIAAKVNSVLQDDRNLIGPAYSNAALVAGRLGLTSCVESLVKCITVLRPQKPRQVVPI